jgi:hypothetical protein
MPVVPGISDDGAGVVEAVGASMLEGPSSVGLAERGINGDKVLWMTLGLRLRLGLGLVAG